MVGLSTALQNAASAMDANSEAIAISGMNLDSQNVPGYARQNVQLTADAFNPSAGWGGGVTSQNPQDSRSQFAEQAVWYQQSQTGYAQAFGQASNSIFQVMGLNDVSGGSGIQGDLSTLFASFASLSSTPNSTATQNGVLADAQAAAVDISSAAQQVRQSLTTAQSSVQSVVGQVNELVGQIQQWNQQAADGTPLDAGSQAQIYNTLEQLSNLVPITTIQNSNGSLNILMNGQTYLLNKLQQNTLQANAVPPSNSSTYPQGPASLVITDSSGKDVTSTVGSGQLGGLVNYINTFVPSLIGNGSQQGALNQLAQHLADSVNTNLGGTTPLFQYDSSNPTSVAATLKLNPAFTNTDLASAVAANPNSAENIAQLVNSSNPTDQINGLGFTDFFNSTADQVSNSILAQQSSLNLHTQLLNQAQTLRQQIQGVSLPQEAANLLEFQQGFEAASRVASTVNSLMQTTIEMVGLPA